MLFLVTAHLLPELTAGIALNAARRSALQKKRHALATRMAARADDYLRFAYDLRVPFSNNQAEQVIRAETGTYPVTCRSSVPAQRSQHSLLSAGVPCQNRDCIAGTLT